ncbi:Uncharacterised protein [Mycobacteroides abscessus]|nr:Uncharacterised protein [Mycobacteroides abscessus]
MRGCSGGSSVVSLRTMRWSVERSTRTRSQRETRGTSGSSTLWTVRTTTTRLRRCRTRIAATSACFAAAFHHVVPSSLPSGQCQWKTS